jgi:hypothetical protein
VVKVKWEAGIDADHFPVVFINIRAGIEREDLGAPFLSSHYSSQTFLNLLTVYKECIWG